MISWLSGGGRHDIPASRLAGRVFLWKLAGGASINIPLCMIHLAVNNTERTINC